MIRDLIFTFEGEEKAVETIYLVALRREGQKLWNSRDEFDNIDDAKIALEEYRNKYKGGEFDIFKYVKTESIERV